ncbi:MAG: 50S ribosomal protein L9 [Parachlamydiaceae bacterium]|nr:50S ribosomal protein L9 [Parachlamydiaceae bacterium]
MATKLLLVQDVENLGRSGDIVSVKPGYARNKLVPTKVAVLADKKSLRMQARLQEERLKKAIEDKKDAELLAEKINGKTVTTIVKVDHDGHMYGSVSVNDILHLVQEQLSLTLEKRFVHLAHAIKKTGVTEIPLRLAEGITASFTVKVVAEGAEEEAETEKAEAAE